MWPVSRPFPTENEGLSSTPFEAEVSVAHTVTASTSSDSTSLLLYLTNPTSWSASSSTLRSMHDSNQSSTASRNDSSARFLVRAWVLTSIAGHQAKQSLPSYRIQTFSLTWYSVRLVCHHVANVPHVVKSAHKQLLIAYVVTKAISNSMLGVDLGRHVEMGEVAKGRKIGLFAVICRNSWIAWRISASSGLSQRRGACASSVSASLFAVDGTVWLT